MAEFSQHYPSLTIDLIPVPKAIKLSHREADIVIAIDRPKSGPYIITRLSNYCLKLYGSQHYLQQNPEIKKLEDLQQHRFVDYIDDLVYSTALYSLERFPCRSVPVFAVTVFWRRKLPCVQVPGWLFCRNFWSMIKANSKRFWVDQVSFTHTFWMLTLVDLQHEPKIKLVWDFLRKQADLQQDLLMGR